MKLRISAAVLAAVILVPTIAVALWFGYWFLARENTEQRYKVNTGTQQYQSALIAQQRDRVLAYDLATNADQKAAIAAQLCQINPSISPLPADLASAGARICY